MAVELTPFAETCLTRLADHYEAKDRLEASLNLLRALQEAQRIILSNPARGLAAPSPYKDLHRLGFQWIKVRRHWIAYRASPPLITSIFHETANIPGWF